MLHDNALDKFTLLFFTLLLLVESTLNSVLFNEV